MTTLMDQLEDRLQQRYGCAKDRCSKGSEDQYGRQGDGSR
jgi:hypothetical protein